MAPKLKELNAIATLVSETPASEDEFRLEFLVSLNSPLAELAMVHSELASPVSHR